jgi:hypothetical protein
MRTTKPRCRLFCCSSLRLGGYRDIVGAVNIAFPKLASAENFGRCMTRPRSVEPASTYAMRAVPGVTCVAPAGT